MTSKQVSGVSRLTFSYLASANVLNSGIVQRSCANGAANDVYPKLPNSGLLHRSGACHPNVTY